MVAFILVIVGALNWGLVGLFGFNLVETVLGGMPAIERAVYVLVGLSAVWEVLKHRQNCKMCAPSAM
jgi:uncharacterized membrane protein YuzA (DUF378 family)